MACKVRLPYNADIREIKEVAIMWKQNNKELKKLKERLFLYDSDLKIINAKDEILNDENLKDIAGIRIICTYYRDIYRLAKFIKNQADIKLVQETDYITNPKPNGYRSYHMIIRIPVLASQNTEYVKVGIQIRTAGMDSWACLEQKVCYRYAGRIPRFLKNELKECANKIAELEQEIFPIHDGIKLMNTNFLRKA